MVVTRQFGVVVIECQWIVCPHGSWQMQQQQVIPTAEWSLAVLFLASSPHAQSSVCVCVCVHASAVKVNKLMGPSYTWTQTVAPTCLGALAPSTLAPRRGYSHCESVCPQQPTQQSDNPVGSLGNCKVTLRVCPAKVATPILLVQDMMTSPPLPSSLAMGYVVMTSVVTNINKDLGGINQATKVLANGQLEVNDTWCCESLL